MWFGSNVYKLQLEIHILLLAEEFVFHIFSAYNLKHLLHKDREKGRGGEGGEGGEGGRKERRKEGRKEGRAHIRTYLLHTFCCILCIRLLSIQIFVFDHAF
jgi:hypothetical protein